jgi:hypothetical protein
MAVAMIEDNLLAKNGAHPSRIARWTPPFAQTYDKWCPEFRDSLRGILQGFSRIIEIIIDISGEISKIMSEFSHEFLREVRSSENIAGAASRLLFHL